MHLIMNEQLSGAYIYAILMSTTGWNAIAIVCNAAEAAQLYSVACSKIVLQFESEIDISASISFTICNITDWKMYSVTVVLRSYYLCR